MRDQAISHRRRTRRRTVRSASSVGLRRQGVGLLRWLLRAIPAMIYLAVLILAAWLLYYSIASPYFAVRDVVISGNRLLDPEQARDAAGALGRNVLLVGTDGIEQSVGRISVVRRARAVLALPGRVEIDVTERTPLVQWQARGVSFLVDREGVVFSRGIPPDPVALVRDLDGPAIEVGSRVDPGVLAAIETLEVALPLRAGIWPSWFDYSRSSGVTVPIPGGPRLVFGDAEDLDGKLATLAAIRGHLEATRARAEMIDLRFKGRPAYTLASSGPAKSSGQTR